MHRILHEVLEVSPEGPQTQRSAAITLTSGALIQISATGLIGSGVLFSGLTPPAGWDNFLASASDTDWPYHGASDSERYCLIAQWEPREGTPGDWFFIGNGRTVVCGIDPVIPGGVGQVRFAVNRPSPDTAPTGIVIDPGDGRWDVTIDAFAPDPGDTPDCTSNPGPNEACMAITGILGQMRVQADLLCEAITHARGDRDTTSSALLASGIALGGAVTALAVFGGVVVMVQGAIQAAAVQGATAALGTSTFNPAIIAQLAVAIAAQIAAAAPAAVRGGWVTALIYAVLVALVAATLIWFLAEILELTMRNTDLSIARSNFAGQLVAMQSAIARAAMVCCSFDNSLPACSDF